MKRHLLMVVVAIFVCINVAFAQKDNQKDYVEVIYFHGKQRCMTCRAIEANTKEVIYQSFANQIKQAKVRLKVVDISTEEGEKIADAYKVTWSSLFVNKWKNGKEIRHDLTQMGFKNARSNALEFKNQLKKTINESLK
jgi:hypothetical protein